VVVRRWVSGVNWHESRAVIKGVNRHDSRAVIKGVDRHDSRGLSLKVLNLLDISK
jgi:hypothetical protein